MSSGQNYSYDPEGSVTQDAVGQRFGYDAENRQNQFFAAGNNTSTPDATYSYDGESKRVKKVSATETTIFVYDGGGQLVAEYSTQISQTPQVSYLTTDHLGSPRIITDQNGAVTSRKDYSTFGDETITSQRTTGLGYNPPSVRQDYTGYQKDDESGLEFAQARYYSSTLGRYTSVDPMIASATIKNPQTFNRYSYVLNSPYEFSDPLGLLPESHSSPPSYGCSAEFASCGDDGWGTWNDGPTQDSNTAQAETPIAHETEQQQAQQPEPPPAPTADQNADPPPPPFTVGISADTPGIIQNFETSSGLSTEYQTGVGAMMRIQLTGVDGKPMEGVKFTESVVRLEGAVGTGGMAPNSGTGTTGANGTIEDVVMRSVFSSPIPEPFGSRLAGSNANPPTAPTLDEVKDHVNTTPYKSPQQQTLTLTLRDGAKYAVTFNRTLSNLDSEGKVSASVNSNKVNYTLTWGSPSIKLISQPPALKPIK